MQLSTTERIRLIASRKGLELGYIAEKTNQTRQNFSNKMKHGDFRESDLAKIADALGCTLEIKILDKETGEEY